MKQKFQEGDRVVISKKHKDRYNCITCVGTVIDIDRTVAGDVIIPVDDIHSIHTPSTRKKYYVLWDDKSFVSPYYSYELEKYVEPEVESEKDKCMNNKRKFQVGDHAIVKTGYCKGEEVVVKEITDFHGRCAYITNHPRFGIGLYYSYDLDHTAPEKEETHKFKKGQWVKMTEYAKQWLIDHFLHISFESLDRAFIITDLCYSVAAGKNVYKLNNNNLVNFYEEDLIPCEGESFKFHLGDKVMLTDRTKNWINKHYDGANNCYFRTYLDAYFTVTSLDHTSDGRAVYSLDNCYDLAFDNDALILFEKKDNLSRTSELGEQSIKDVEVGEEKLGHLKTEWKTLCNSYLEAFCKKHEYTYEPDAWIGSDPGTIIEIADMFVSMDNIRYDIDHEVPESYFEKWYWKSLDVHELTDGAENYMNYENYCKGCPDYWTEERMNSVREAKKRLSEAKESLEKEIENIKHNKYNKNSFNHR